MLRLSSRGHRVNVGTGLGQSNSNVRCDLPDQGPVLTNAQIPPSNAACMVQTRETAGVELAFRPMPSCVNDIDVDIKHPLQDVGPKNIDFFGPEMTMN